MDPKINVTTWGLVALLAIILVYELATWASNRPDLTITATLRSWSPAAVLLVLLGLVVLGWHVWVDH
jgi:hypothetical protein